MAKAFPDLNKDGEVTQADVLMGRGVNLDRDNNAMGSLMMPPEREALAVGSVANLLKAVLKPKTKQAKKVSKKLQETYNTEEIEEAVKELVELVDVNTKINKKGKADLKITKSNLVTEASDNLANKDILMPTDALNDILKLDNIREGSGGKTDNLYDSIIQLAASKIEEPSLMGQFVQQGSDMASLATKGSRETVVDTGLKAATAGALLSNLDRLSESVQKLYSDLNPTEKERLLKDFSAAQKEGLSEFDFTTDDGITYPVAVKLAAEDNPDVVYERVEKFSGSGLSGITEEDLEAYTALLEQRDRSLAAAENEAARQRIQENFEKQTQNFTNLSQLEAAYAKMLDRQNQAHGGSSGVAILMPAEYKEPPKDTYNNISSKEEKEEVENMNSDSEMEEEYLDYVTNEVLTQEEQDYLFKTLDEDNKLEKILDKVMLNATEFTGDGEIEGPGSGISDSIPARLSDGEFVFTRKATDQIGADKLQKMMDDAERKFDSRNGKANGGEAGTSPFVNPEETSNPLDRFEMDKDDERDIERQMLYSSRMPSLMNR